MNHKYQQLRDSNFKLVIKSDTDESILDMLTAEVEVDDYDGHPLYVRSVNYLGDDGKRHPRLNSFEVEISGIVSVRSRLGEWDFKNNKAYIWSEPVNGFSSSSEIDYHQYPMLKICGLTNNRSTTIHASTFKHDIGNGMTFMEFYEGHSLFQSQVTGINIGNW